MCVFSCSPSNPSLPRRIRHRLAHPPNLSTAIIHTMTGPEWNSSDEESVAEEKIVGKKTPEEKKAARNVVRVAAAKRAATDELNAASSVLYVGHLPPAFEEHELVLFLKQFGKVLNLRVARSKKTGNSKGYAFVQMHSPGVAAIVADTLAGYILFGQRRLVCHVVPPDRIHKKMFFKIQKQPAAKHVSVKPLGKLKAITSRLVQRERKKREQLKELGIDYDFPGYEAGDKAKVDDAKEEKAAPKEDSKTTDKKTSKKTKRKDSVTSVESTAASVNSASQKAKKKRKDSITSVDSAGSKKKRRSAAPDASASVPTTVAQSTKKAKKPKTPTRTPSTRTSPTRSSRRTSS